MSITWDGLLYEIYSCFPNSRSVGWNRGSIIKEYELEALSDGRARLTYTYKDGFGTEYDQTITDKNVIKKLIPLEELKIVVRHVIWQRIEVCQEELDTLLKHYREYDPCQKEGGSE